MSDIDKRIDEDKLTAGLCDSPETCAPEKPEGVSEDWLALAIGLLVFVLSLGVFLGTDILGWGAKIGVWTDPSKAFSVASSAWAAVTSGFTGLFYTFLFMLLLMVVAARLMRANIPRFVLGFSVIFWLSILCYFLGHYAYIAATKNQTEKFGIPWALSLTGEFGFIIALVVGLIIGNFLPRFAEWLKEAARLRAVHQDGHRYHGSRPGFEGGRIFRPGHQHHVPGLLRHRRSLPDILGTYLLHRQEMVWL